MYKTIDFVRAFAKSRGFTVQNEECAMEILLPHVMMGVVYQCYTDNIKKLTLKQDLKQARTRWSDAYTKFNRFLFDSFENADMVDDFCDQMERFAKFMYLDTVKLQSKMMRLLPKDLDVKDKNVLSAAVLCNRIAKEAQQIWGHNVTVELVMPVRIDGQIKQVTNKIPSTNVDLDGVITYTKRFVTLWMKNNPKMREIVSGDDLVKDMFESLDDFVQRCVLFANLDRSRQ